MTSTTEAALAGDKAALARALADAVEGPLSSHLGAWHGENRLWFEPGAGAERCDGSLIVLPDAVGILWSFRGEPQRGTLRISGSGNGVEVTYQDSWHSKEPMSFRGRMDDRLLDVVGSYPAGEGPDWGWRIELDLRDPDAAALRMFNIPPDEGDQLAVELVGARGD